MTDPQQTNEEGHRRDDSRSQLELDIAEARGSIRAHERQVRRMLIVLGLGVVATLVLMVYFQYRSGASLGIPELIVYLIGGVVVYAFLSVYISVLLSTRKERLVRDLESLLARQRVRERYEEDEPSYIDSLVAINIENLAEYYSMIRNQTDNSYRASLVAGIVGFGLLAAGTILGVSRGEEAQTQVGAYIAAASGVITEFIAGVFFFLYNRTVTELRGYHESLLSMQSTLLSLKLIDSVEDDTRNADMKAQMIWYLAGGGRTTARSSSSPPDSAPEALVQSNTATTPPTTAESGQT